MKSEHLAGCALNYSNNDNNNPKLFFKKKILKFGIQFWMCDIHFISFISLPIHSLAYIFS